MGAGSVGVRAFAGIIALASVFVGEGLAHATSVSGAITSDQTWTLAGSPYVMTGDVTVGAGVTLTVEAGVSVQAAGTDALAAGASPSLVELNVNGALQVSGTVDAPVSFTSLSAASWNDWYGVVVAASGTATINDASFTHATYGIRSSTSTLNVTASSFDNDTYGLYVQSGTAVLSGSFVTSCSSGVYAYGGTVLLSSSVLRGNDIGADSIGNGPLFVQSCTVDHNVYGLRLVSSGFWNVQVSDSLVTSNTGYGVYSLLPGGILLNGVDFYGNAVHAQNTMQAEGAPAPSYCNPLYVSANDLHLTSNSPFLTAAAGNQPYGALAYRGDATPGLYGVLRSDTTIPAAGSPHSIPGDLEVAPGVTLTLEPGATLSFANAADSMNCGDNLTRSELRVHGQLHASGTSAAPITFTTSGTLTDTS